MPVRPLPKPSRNDSPALIKALLKENAILRKEIRVGREAAEIDLFAEQLEDAGKSESAKAIREMIELSVKSTDCLRDALKNL